MDRHDLYELCVQSPRHAVELLCAIHGGNPMTLGEDFCGTCAVSRAWVGSAEGRRAVGADLNEGTLARARERKPSARLKLVRTDVVASPVGDGADVIFVGNFSIGEIHARDVLVRYLRHARARLGAGGVFVCDTYGGASAFRVGAVTRTHVAGDGTLVRYTWEHRRADAATGMVENAIHFRVVRGGEVVSELPDAFTYRWRLWSIPELRDAMTEAGFGATSVHMSLGDAAGVESGSLPADYIVCVAGRRV